MSKHGFHAHHTIEVGGPGGIRLNTHTPVLDAAPPARERVRALSLATHHPRGAAVALSLVGVILVAGPLVLVLTVRLPMWMLVGPIVLAGVAFVAAATVSRGALLRLERARRRPELERQLLELAVRTRGRLTVPLAARHLSVALPEAEELLTSLARAGYVDIDIDPQTGAVLYLFPSLDTEDP
jgi:hypothetical protein